MKIVFTFALLLLLGLNLYLSIKGRDKNPLWLQILSIVAMGVNCVAIIIVNQPKQVPEKPFFTFTLVLLAGLVLYTRFKYGSEAPLKNRILSIVAIGALCIATIIVNQPKPIREDLLPPPRPSINHEVPTPESGIGDATNTTDFNPDSI